MRNALFISLITATSLLLLTCGEAEIAPPPTPGPGAGPPMSGPITDEQQIEVLDRCVKFVNEIGDLRSGAAQQIVVAWLRLQPEFEEADTTIGNVWASFRDGRMVVIVPNWRGTIADDGGRLPKPIVGGRAPGFSTTARTQGQPESNKVELFYSHGKGFTDFRPTLKKLFDTSKARSKTEYDVTLKDGSIENLMNARDLGVFFIDGHGGMCRKRSNRDQYLYGLWTTDKVSDETNYKYAAELNSDLLVYMIAVVDTKDGRDVYEKRYAITQHFVRHYMNFAENAVLYNDACSGMHAEAKPFWDAMIEKATNKKATYIAWTDKTDNGVGAPTAGYIFDRMLGTNMDVPGVVGEYPDQRPFDFSAIFDDMRSFPSLGVSSYGGSLAFHSVNTSETILRPSIEYIGVDEYESKMYIKGLFGDKNASDLVVTVGGLRVPAEYVHKNLLMCDLPSVGPGSVGDVVVAIRGNKSNVVPLTEWIIPLDFEKEEMDIMLKGSLNLRIRADVHPYRSKPGGAPKNERPDTLGFLSNPNFPGWPFAIGSTGNYTAGGRHYNECVVKTCHVIESLTALRKNGVLPYSIFEGPRDGFVGYYKWSVDMKTLYVSAMHAKVPDVGHEFESRVDCGGDPAESNQSAKRELEIRIPEDLPVLQLHIDENYNIQFGDFESSKDVTNKWGQCTNTVKLNVKVKWPDVGPRFPPTRETESRVGGD